MGILPSYKFMTYNEDYKNNGRPRLNGDIEVRRERLNYDIMNE
jgi:hypothetical protein